MIQALVIADTTLPTSPIGLTVDARRTIEEFFQAEIHNPHTRRAYMRGAADFLSFVGARYGIASLETITPPHVANWLDDMTARRLAVPTQKLRLAGLRMMFNALVRAQVLRISPVAVVKGPPHRVRKGKTPVLAGDEAQQLLDSIPADTLIGLRDRAIIAVMMYTFARIGAVTALDLRDVFRQQRRLWLRLSEKGGKCHDVPCHHRLEAELSNWIEASGPDAAPDAPLFRSFMWAPTDATAASGATDQPTDAKAQRILSTHRISQSMAWEMLQRRAKAAGIDTRICNHTFRATGITAYLRNGGTIERAAHIAGHASTRTTQLYDRRSDDITLDEIEKIRFTNP